MQADIICVHASYAETPPVSRVADVWTMSAEPLDTQQYVRNVSALVNEQFISTARACKVKKCRSDVEIGKRFSFKRAKWHLHDQISEIMNGSTTQRSRCRYTATIHT